MQASSMVSVIIPAYNASSTIGEAVNSILNQNYRNLEIIIIDDGSNDETSEKIALLEDPRVRAFQNHKNLGYLKTVNFAITQCRGEYIAFQDADDISCGSRLKRQLEALIESGSATIALTQCVYHYVSSGVRDEISNFPSTKRELIPLLVSGETKIFCGASLLVKREVFSRVGQFRLIFDRLGAEHLDWFLRALRTEDFITVDEPLYRYQVRSGSFSRSIATDPLKNHSAQLALFSFLSFRISGRDPLASPEIFESISAIVRGHYFSKPGTIEYSSGLQHLVNGELSNAISSVVKLAARRGWWLSLKLASVIFLYNAILIRLPVKVTRLLVQRRNRKFVRWLQGQLER